MTEATPELRRVYGAYLANEEARSRMDIAARLLEVHGPGPCPVCGLPKAGAGLPVCSYPHGMLPVKSIGAGSMWCWEPPDGGKTE